MIGTTIATYRIVERVGQGGMGVVYRAVDLMLEREVAVKVLSRELSGEPRIVERFRSEALTLARLNHPNIATLHALFVERGDLFMVMEFLRGEPLENRIRRAGALSLNEGTAVVCQALEGVHHAHELGIVHRDLKPSNLMITPDGVVKVMDFGIARALGAARQTQEGRLVGTIEYMSPEQIRGCEADRRSDLYSMGVVLYESLTGQLPFSATSEFELMRAHVESPPIPPRSLNPDLPAEIEAILMQSLAKDPAERFQSAADFRLALLPILERGARLAGRSTTGDLARQVLAPPTAKPPSIGVGQPPILPPLPPRSRETRLADASTGEPLEQQARETRFAAAPVDALGRAVPLGSVIQELFSRLGWKTYVAAFGVVVLVGMLWLLWPAGETASEESNRGLQPPASLEVTPATADVQPPAPPASKTAAPVDYENLPGVIPAETVQPPEPPPAPKKAVAAPKRAEPSAAARTTASSSKEPETSVSAEQPAGEQQAKSGESGAETPPPTDLSATDKSKEAKEPSKEDARSLLRRHLGKDKKKEP